MNKVIHVNSIREAVANGRLVELSSDYRTSGTVRASLPSNTSYAVSPSAFIEHIQNGVLGELSARIDAFCRDLNKAVAAHNRDSLSSDFVLTLRGKDGQPQHHALKLNWLAAPGSWVVTLPEEELRLRTALR